jgi:uncharacterized protein (TIGR03437 family)
VLRAWLVLAVLLSGTARGAAPNYSAAGIVNTANYTLGPFAPNSIVSIYGSGLARSAEGVALAPGALYLPIEINYVRVFVENQPAALFYVSDSQINFLMPSTLLAGNVTIRVATEGNSGPEITAVLVNAAPALFFNPAAADYALATHADGRTLVAAESPAHIGDTVVIYLTGLGRTSQNPAPGQILPYAALIVALPDLKVSLGGTPLDPVYIKYAGLTPGSAGLYQLNLYLPNYLGPDPEIRVSVAGQSSPAGLKLAVR